MMNEQADLKRWRYNTILLVEKVYQLYQKLPDNDGLRMTIHFETNVVETADRYLVAFKQRSAGLEHLLKKWSVQG